MLLDLLGAQMTQSQIGAAIGVHQTRISQVINSASPQRFSYEAGRRLVALHRRVMKKVNTK